MCNLAPFCLTKGAVGVLLEGRPVADRLQPPLLGEVERAVDDTVLVGVEITAVEVGELLESVVVVQLVEMHGGGLAGGHGVLAPGAVRGVVVAVRDPDPVGRRAAVVLFLTDGTNG
ncbi:MAG: hypothetical protein ACYSWU_24625 [Planctomycetota bacterium]